MAFVPLASNEPGEAFLSTDGYYEDNAGGDDFATLDAMVPHAFNNAGANSLSNPAGGVASGSDGGFAGVSESLFDRIRAKTAEHQQQQRSHTQPSQPQLPSHSRTHFSDAPAVNPPTSMNYQQDFLAGSMPAGAPPTEQPEFERGPEVSTPSPAPAVSAGGEPTYYASSGPSNFAPAPAPPTYGPSRTWPSSAASEQSHTEGLTMQDKAAMALEQTSGAMGNIFGRASAGAQSLVAAARGAGNKHGLLEREEQYGLEREEGMAAPSHSLPTQDFAVGETGTSASGTARDQAYSMVSYGKTFCQDMSGFVWQLPIWGKALIAIILLWIIFSFFDFI